MLNAPADEARVARIAAFLRAAIGPSRTPLLGLICGSGIGGVTASVVDPLVIPYEEIPSFPVTTVEGHAGQLVFGRLGRHPVVCMKGRFHCFEGYSVEEVTLPVRVLQQLGIQYLLVTNAAGGLDPVYNVGDVVVLHGHLNLPSFGGRVPAGHLDHLEQLDADKMSRPSHHHHECYDEKLQHLAFQVAEDLGVAHKVHKRGVYCFVSGPTFETPVECRFLRVLGGDTVGMSSVPEILAAHGLSLRVFALSVITNKAVFPEDQHLPPVSHDEVLAAADSAKRFVAHALLCTHILNTSTNRPLFVAPAISSASSRRSSSISATGTPQLDLVEASWTHRTVAI